MKRIGFALAMTIAMVSIAATAQAENGAQTIQDASSALDEILTLHMRRLPEKMIANAEAVAIIPNVVKVGFVAGIQRGHGVVVFKNKDGSWTMPRFITLTGGSIGWQVGAQATDLILVFRTPRSVESLLKGKLKLGADASVAAGPVGRVAEAATDIQLRAEIYSYSRSRGLFAGIALDGSAIQFDANADAAYYAPLPGAPPGAVPEAASKLTQRIVQLANPPAAQPGVVIEGPGAPLPGDPNQPIPLAPAAPANPLDPAWPDPVQPANAPLALPAPRVQVDTRADLARSAAQLNQLLDERWQRFLALPAGVYQGNPPAAAELQQSLQQFNAVATKPEYRDLAQRPEFQATYRLLQRYLAELAPPPPATLVLPPPPDNSR